MKTLASATCLKFGGLLHRVGVRRGTARLYAAAASLNPADPAAAFRLGVVLQDLGRYEGARGAYTAALEAGFADRPAALRRRATVNDRIDDCEAAFTDHRSLVDLGAADRQVWGEIAEYQSGLGRLPETVDALDRVSELGKSTYKESRRRAELKAEIGDWEGSLALYRELIAQRPDDSKLASQAGSVADRLCRVPFRLKADGIVPADEEARRTAGLEAAALFGQSAEDGARVWAVQHQGNILDHLGDRAAAEAAFDESIRRAEAADKSWSEYQMNLWGFRRDRMLRGGDPEATDDRLAYSIIEGEPIANLSEAVGYASVQIENSGLFVTGFVLHGAADTVTLSIDGEPVHAVDVDRTRWLPSFKLAMKFPLLRRFGPSTTIAVSASGAPLVTSNLTDRVRIENPRGDGTFQDLRAAGHTINKKGHWSPNPEADEWSAAGALDAYTRLKEFMELRFDRKLFVFYGTLLGCHRDGALIPGDDDFDAGYVSRGSTPEEAKRDSIEIMRALIEAGFDVGTGFTGRPFKIRLNGCGVDVNPVWFHRGKAFAFNSHDLGPEHFEPAEVGTLEGREVYVPARTEAFLEDNYGPDWRIPNSGFRYYRSKLTVATIRRTQLVLSEMRAMREFAERARQTSPEAGVFYGSKSGAAGADPEE